MRESYRTSNPGLPREMAVQGGIALFVTLSCYLIGAWRIEEEFAAVMRNLRSPYARIEWILRVVILICIGYAWTLSSGATDLWELGQIGAGLAFLGFCFVLFLGWDMVVALGGAEDVAWKFFALDIVGAVATLICLYSHLNHEELGSSLGRTALLVYAVLAVVFFRKNILDLARRLFSRTLLR